MTPRRALGAMVGVEVLAPGPLLLLLAALLPAVPASWASA